MNEHSLKKVKYFTQNELAILKDAGYVEIIQLAPANLEVPLVVVDCYAEGGNFRFKAVIDVALPISLISKVWPNTTIVTGDTDQAIDHPKRKLIRIPWIETHFPISTQEDYLVSSQALPNVDDGRMP